MPSISPELKRGTLEMILLNLLRERDMYGYEMILRLKESGGETFKIEGGTIYPVLYRLQNDGLIELRLQPVASGVPRKHYHLTDEGARRADDLVDQWKEFIAVVTRLLGPA